MNTIIYSDFDCQKYINENLANLSSDVFIFLNPQEYLFDINNLIGINDILSKNNKFLIFFIGSEFNKKIVSKLTNIKVINWDSIDFFSKHRIFFSDFTYNDLFKNIEHYEALKNSMPIKYFASLNVIKICKEWRLFIIDELFKNKLNDFIKINYLLDKRLDVVKIDDVNIEIDIFNITNIEILDSFPYQSNCLPDDYMKCAFDIVLETIYDYFFVTEKTLRPIDAKKPFFVFSCSNFHKKLVNKYGFKLYDNIIDYSFDNEKNTIVRWNMQIQELIKLKETYSLEEIYKLTRCTVEHNYKILNDIRHSKIIDNIYYDVLYDKFINYHENDNIKKFIYR